MIMEAVSNESRPGSNLLKLLGIVVGSFALFQTVIPIFSLVVVPMGWITKAGWRKFPVNWWGRFCAILVVLLLTAGSYYALKAGIEADRAKAKLEWMRLSPAEIVMTRKVVEQQTVSALLMDPLNWRRWRSWSESKQLLEHAGSE
jgi:hypothetical protein